VCYAVVDEQDFDLSERAWRLDKDGYARTNIIADGKMVSRYMHRVILARATGRELTRLELTDHINRNKLDNRRGNLRIAGKSLNSANTWADRVTWHKKAKKWQVLCCKNGKNHYDGLYSDKADAIEAARKLFADLWPEVAYTPRRRP
jgi:hypothetical protein